MKITKRKILVWVATFVLWGLFFYSMTVQSRPAAIELIIALFAILATGVALTLTLRAY